MNEQVRIIAHRGYLERYPENTLPALQAAADAGADGIELDVQLCRDGVPVVLHDATLDRVSGQSGSVIDLSFEELQAYSVHEPARLGDTFKGTRIPSLEQAVTALQPASALIFVEIKSDSIAHHAVPQVVDSVLQICRPLEDRLVVISFDAAIIKEARSLGAQRVGWVLSDWRNSTRELLMTLQPDFAFIGLDALPPTPASPWEGPWEWAVYEVNTWSEAATFAQRGFRWIETQAVETLIAGRDGA